MGQDFALVPRSIEEAASLAAKAAASGMIPCRRPEEALVILLTGLELGLRPMQAFRGIYVVNGRPVLSADLLVACVRSSGLCKTWKVLESTPDRCTIETQREGENTPRTMTWTKADAERAGLLSKGGTWKQYPAQMLKHRVAADLAREVYPDVVLGLYTADELGGEEREAPRPAREVPSAPVRALESPMRPPVLGQPRPEVEQELRRVDRQAETLPAPAREPGDDSDGEAFARETEAVLEVPAALENFYGRIAEIELPGEAVAVWIKHRADLAALPGGHRESAWKALCKKTEQVGRMKNAKVWLKKAIAIEDARGPGLTVARPEDDEPPPTGTGPGKSTPKNTAANGTGSSAVGSTGSSPRARAWTEEEVCSLPQAWEAHLRRKPHVLDPANARGRTSEYAELASGYLKRREAFQAAGISDEALDILRAELRVRGCMEPDALLAGVIGRRQKAA